LRYSGNILAVSKMLGHANVATTQVYLNHLGLGDPRRRALHVQAFWAQDHSQGQQPADGRVH
jgi:site-specific recombinase XerD